jgi:hypothetical protein
MWSPSAPVTGHWHVADRPQPLVEVDHCELRVNPGSPSHQTSAVFDLMVVGA